MKNKESEVSKMLRQYNLLSTIVMLLILMVARTSMAAVSVAGRSFDPPRLYFKHANMNKNGVASAIKGQDNFLTVYMTGISKKEKYAAEGFSFVVLVPDCVEVLEAAELSSFPFQPLEKQQIIRVDYFGRPYLRIEITPSSEAIKKRCIDAGHGVEYPVWIRVDNTSCDEFAIETQLFFKGEKLYANTAKLKIYDELVRPPSIDPKLFKFYLHYGPYYRIGYYDELAEYLGKAGFNGVHIMAWNTQLLKEMANRQFYTVIQRVGSYNMTSQTPEVMTDGEKGRKWFEELDAGMMEEALPYADAVIWDYEPNPARMVYWDWPKTPSWFAHANADMKVFNKVIIDSFKAYKRIPDTEEVTSEILKEKYAKEFMDFRQNQFATAIKSWADFVRSIKPGVDTILCEGRMNVYDPFGMQHRYGQIDYSRYYRFVTYCDPMNFTQPSSWQNMERWIERVPGARFTGCQNVASGGNLPLVAPAKTTMMQVIGAALLGMKGTSIYPGQAMDGENFVLFNSVMTFLSQHQDYIFKGRRKPENVIFEPIFTKIMGIAPDEDEKNLLGIVETRPGQEGTRFVYPDAAHFKKTTLARTYYHPKLKDYLAVVANGDEEIECNLRLRAFLPDKHWLLTDGENKIAYTSNGKPEIAVSTFERGVYLSCPANDYRGFRFRVVKKENLEEIKDYQKVALEELQRAYFSRN